MTITINFTPMYLTKCDVCKMIIKRDRKKYSLSGSKPWFNLDICEKCGKSFEAVIDKAQEKATP